MSVLVVAVSARMLAQLAVAAGYANSAVSSATYTISTVQAAASPKHTTNTALQVTYAAGSPQLAASVLLHVGVYGTLGPAVMAKAALEPQGRWEDLKRDMLAMFEESNEAGDGSFEVQAEYLVTVAELPAWGARHARAPAGAG